VQIQHHDDKEKHEEEISGLKFDDLFNPEGPVFPQLMKPGLGHPYCKKRAKTSNYVRRVSLERSVDQTNVFFYYTIVRSDD
jgi:hypothetical protein